jgi:hypothetical protein
METICFSETPVPTYESTRRKTPEEQHRQCDHCVNLSITQQHIRVGLYYRKWDVHPRPGVAVRDHLHQRVLATLLLPATADHSVQPRTGTSAEALRPRRG